MEKYEDSRIVVVGSINIDLIVRCPRLPRAGETLLGGDLLTSPGGKGANQAVAAARVAGVGKAAIVGCVGEDYYGNIAVENLINNGVSVMGVIRDKQASSGVALITTDPTGENTIVVSPGSNTHLVPEMVKKVLERSNNAKVLLCQLEIPIEAVKRSLEIANEMGMVTVLNYSPVPVLGTPFFLKNGEEMKCLPEILVVNEVEAAAITGMAIDASGIEEASIEDVLNCGKRIIEMGLKAAVITLGKEGALALMKNKGTVETIKIDPFIATPVDTTGAGDAFVGVMAAALSDDLSFFEACRWGAAAAAVVVSENGAQTPRLTRDALMEMLGIR